MKKTIYLLLFLLSASLFSCNPDRVANKEASIVKKSKAETLIEKIVSNGDFINSANVPAMVSTQEVHDAAKGEYLIIDLRSSKDFADGHIADAINIKLKELLDYLITVDKAKFKKIVMVCYTGQTANYATSVLRLLGNKNVYALKWGMCSWNKKFNGRWLSNTSNRLATNLVTETKPKNAKGDLPEIKSIRTSGTDLINFQASKVLHEGFKAGAIGLDNILANPTDYYIISYMDLKTYNLGHIEGAVQYSPKESLSLQKELLTLPSDKKIVIYSYTGQHSASVAAYLRMLGYDATSLKYGANGFMHDMMQNNSEIGHAFSEQLINNFETVTSEYIPDGEAQEGGC